MTVTPQMFLIVLPLVFAASVVDAIGGGGGLISLPAYMVAGLPSDLASGSNKLSACFGTLIATGKFFRSGKIMMKPALCAAAMAIIGAFIGAQINERLSDAAFRVVLLLLVPAMACSAIGGYIGSWLAIRKGARFIRWVMMGVTVLLLVKLVVDYL